MHSFYKIPSIHSIDQIHIKIMLHFQIYENWQLEKGSAMKFGENQFKVPATEEVMTRLRSNFSIEYEFYEFCKKRLDRQYKSLVMA